MLAIIGAYRRLTHLPNLIHSLDQHATGITRLVIVDDSGDEPTVNLLRRLTWQGRDITVTALNRAGYNVAMRTVWEHARRDHGDVIFLEEDFTLTQDVDFTALATRLQQDTELAQIVLQRQPWFPVEIRAGGLVQACEARGEQFTRDGDLLIHRAFFSGNPTVIRRDVFDYDWPHGDWSEDRMRDQLLEAGYSFGLTVEVMCHHDGRREGKGY